MILAEKQAAWLVTRYDDVAAALKDGRFAKDPNNALTAGQAARLPWIPKMFRPLTRNMLDLDPPDHSRLRGLVHKAFTPRLVEQLRGRNLQPNLFEEGSILAHAGKVPGRLYESTPQRLQRILQGNQDRLHVTFPAKLSHEPSCQRAM